MPFLVYNMLNSDVDPDLISLLKWMFHNIEGDKIDWIFNNAASDPLRTYRCIFSSQSSFHFQYLEKTLDGFIKIFVFETMIHSYFMEEIL